MNKLIAFTFIGVIFAGCVGIPQDDLTPKTSNVTCVVIGMETSQRFGACPGCQKDSNQMADLLRTRYGYPVKLLQSETATRKNVMQTIRQAVGSVGSDGLFILYYSGHGGREFLDAWNTQEPEGADREDEYLCLYDDYLLDDEIWSLISSCRGRVFCCFDACHSKTMYRSVLSDYCLRKGYGQALAIPFMVSSTGGFRLKPRGVALDFGGLRMLCWSGCQEAEYSYGGNAGGVLTNHILRNWKAERTYKTVWELTSAGVTAEQPTQHPATTQYGTGFDLVFQ